MGGRVPRFEKVENETPDFVIGGDDLGPSGPKQVRLCSRP
jgi:hypothetical protein